MTIKNANGPITNDIQRPLMVDGDSVYVQDIDFSNSNFTGWVGNEDFLFQSPFSDSITNSTAANPKQIILAFNRTMKALQIGLGENNGGDFSNTKISLLGSGGATRALFDESTDNTKKTSRNVAFENELFNSILIEFFTADPVSLSNITIQKSRYSTTQIQGMDINGEFHTAKMTDEGYLLTGDFIQEVAAGNVPGHSVYRKFGRIESIQSGTPADCWEFGITPGAEQYTFSTSAIIDSISSSNATDNELVSVTMLDADYVEFTQIVNLNGQNRVALIPGLRFNRAFNANGTPFLGNIYIYENTALSAGVPIDVTKVRGYISTEGQQTLQSIYTVPAGKTAFLYELKTAMGGRKSGFATYEAFLRTFGSIFLIKDTHDLAVTGTSYQNDIFTVPRPFPEKTDFKPLISVDTNGIGFTVAFVVILVDN